jgi:hypothetical protein
MSVKSVVFDIPDKIAKGLESGVYERIGGTIRNSSSGQIVAFLRETSSGLSQVLPSLAQIGSVASILNFGVSLAGFAFVLAKLNQLDNKINGIIAELNEVNFKIDLGFRSKFTAAVKQLSRALVVKDRNLKTSSFSNITQTFSESHEIFKGYFEHDENIITASEYFYLAMFSGLGEAIAYLEMNEPEAAMLVLDEISDYCEVARDIYVQKYSDQWDCLEQEWQDYSNGKDKGRLGGVGVAAIGGGLIGAGLSMTGIGILLLPALGGALAGAGLTSAWDDDTNVHQKFADTQNVLNEVLEANIEAINDFHETSVSLFIESNYILNRNITWEKWKFLSPSSGNDNSQWITISVN